MSKPKFGQLTISRIHTHDTSDYVSLKIQDKISGLSICSLKINIEEFGKAITGSSLVLSEFEFLPTEFTVKNYGKTRQTKRVSIDYNKYHDTKNNSKLNKLIKPHLTDGWMLWSDGLSYQQNKDKHEIILYRFENTDKSKYEDLYEDTKYELQQTRKKAKQLETTLKNLESTLLEIDSKESTHEQ